MNGNHIYRSVFFFFSPVVRIESERSREPMRYRDVRAYGVCMLFIGWANMKCMQHHTNTHNLVCCFIIVYTINGEKKTKNVYENCSLVDPFPIVCQQTLCGLDNV